MNIEFLKTIVIFLSLEATKNSVKVSILPNDCSLIDQFKTMS